MRIQNFLIRKWPFERLLLAVTALTMPFSAAAQDAKVTLPTGRVTAAQVFEGINGQTPYKVTVNKSRMNDDKQVTLRRSPVSVSEVLDLLLAGTGYTYSLDGNIIILPLTAEETRGSQVVVNMPCTVSGTVTDAGSGAPVANLIVEVLIVGTAKAVTDTQGRFSISDIPSGTQVVKLSSADGQLVRYREIGVPAGGDAVVSLTIDGELLSAQSVPQRTIPAPAVKTTAYYVPNTADRTIHAFTDEPKTEYSFIPSVRIGDRAYLPKVGVKTNLLYLATTTPNLAVEFGLARRWTLDIAAGLNPWDLNSRKGGIRHGLVQPEVRYWFCQRFEKHFIGLHGLYGQYEIADINIPIIKKDLRGERYNGWGAGAGVSYGYHLPMSSRWAWEFTVGAGYVYFEYDRYRCGDCDKKLGREAKHYFGPTKAGVSLIFMIK